MSRSLIPGHSGIAIALIASALIAAIAMVPGAWGTAHGQTAGATPTPTPAPTPTAVPVTPSEPATVSVPEAGLEVDVPAGAVDESATVTYTPVSQGDAAQAQQSLFALGIPQPTGTGGAPAEVFSAFQLEATADDGTPITSFDEPVTISIEISPEALAAAGGDAGRISLQFFNEDTGEWEAVPCTVSGSTLQCTVTHFSTWALVVTTESTGTTQPGGDETAPPAGAPAPAETGMGAADAERAPAIAWRAIVGVLLVAGATAVLVRRKALVD